MASINRAELIAALAANVRSNGEGGKTTAQDLRQFLTQLIDAIAAQDSEQPDTVIQLDSILEEMLAPDVREKLNSANAGIAVVQITGNSESQVMSQKAVTQALNAFVTNPANLVHPDRTRNYYATASAAIAEATPGDTLVLPAPVSDVTIAGNEAQLYLSTGLSVHTEGFDVGSLLTSGDAITLVGGTGKIIGKHSRVYSNSPGAWGMGAYRQAPPGMFYEVYDLHFQNRTTCAVILNSDCDVHFYNCHFQSSEGTAVWGRLNNPRLYFHSCTFRITGTSSAAMLSAPVKMVFEQCVILTQNRSVTDHLLGVAQQGEMHLINSTVLAENATTSAVKAGKLVLQGTTSILGLLEATTVLDQRVPGGAQQPGSQAAAPLPPGDIFINDAQDTATFTPNPAFPVTQHEYTLDGGTTTTAASSTTINLGDVQVPQGLFGIRVSASPTNPTGTWLFHGSFTFRELLVNADFNQPNLGWIQQAGWTENYPGAGLDNGTARCRSGHGNGEGYLYQNFGGLTAGQTYRASVRCLSLTEGYFTLFGEGPGVSIYSPGDYSYDFVAGGTNSSLYLSAYNNAKGDFDYLSVKRV